MFITLISDKIIINDWRNFLLNIGEFKLYPLQGGITQMDGGAMFGVVPKALWSKNTHLMNLIKYLS